MVIKPKPGAVRVFCYSLLTVCLMYIRVLVRIERAVVLRSLRYHLQALALKRQQTLFSLKRESLSSLEGETQRTVDGSTRE
jgi:hypothetical protein